MRGIQGVFKDADIIGSCFAFKESLWHIAWFFAAA